jgi:hypothetical protein
VKYSRRIGHGDSVIFEADREPTNKELKQMSKRAERNHLLAESDSMMVSDRGLSESKLTEWKTYRQKLRDLDFSDPDKVTFPTKPE